VQDKLDTEVACDVYGGVEGLGFEADACRRPTEAHVVDKDQDAEEMAQVAKEAEDIHFARNNGSVQGKFATAAWVFVFYFEVEAGENGCRFEV
jgi:16S rRNA G966 N2-methylase RsmD